VREVRLRTRGRADPEELLHAAYLRLMRYRASMPLRMLPLSWCARR
jgi:DNA-directed RNA polymerase specialized sigma24 family protein